MAKAESHRFAQYERLYEIVSWSLTVGLIAVAVTQQAIPPAQRPYLLLIGLLFGLTALVMARLLPLRSDAGISYAPEDKVMVESLIIILLLTAYLYVMIVPMPGAVFLFLPPILIEALVLHERIIVAEAAFAAVAVIFLEMADVTGAAFGHIFIVEFAVFLAIAALMAFLTRRIRVVAEENERLSAHLSARLDQIQVIDQIVRQSEYFPQFDRLISRICEIISDAFDAERCGLFMFDPATDQLELHASSIGFAEQDRQSFGLEENTDAIRKIFDADRPVMAAEGDEEGALKKMVAMRRLRNIMMVPLHVRELSIGVIMVADKREGDFSREDLHFLQLLAGFISTLIDSSQAFARLAQERRTAERVTRLLVGRELRMKELKRELKNNGGDL